MGRLVALAAVARVLILTREGVVQLAQQDKEMLAAAAAAAVRMLAAVAAVAQAQ